VFRWRWQLSKGCGEPVFGVEIDTKFVVAAAQILDKCVAGADDASRAKPFQSPHRPQPGLQAPMIGFDRIINRYERSSVAGLAGRLRFRRGVGWHTVRPSGTGALGVKQVGRPVLCDGLRARVIRWPPLRLARLRCARGSVGVVSPTHSRSQGGLTWGARHRLTWDPREGSHRALRAGQGRARCAGSAYEPSPQVKRCRADRVSPRSILILEGQR
jgi:hypothetical protein